MSDVPPMPKPSREARERAREQRKRAQMWKRAAAWVKDVLINFWCYIIASFGVVMRPVVFAIRSGDVGPDSRLWDLFPGTPQLVLAGFVALLIVLYLESQGDPEGKNSSGHTIARRTFTYLAAGISSDSILDLILGGSL